MGMAIRTTITPALPARTRTTLVKEEAATRIRTTRGWGMGPRWETILEEKGKIRTTQESPKTDREEAVGRVKETSREWGNPLLFLFI